MLIKHISLRIHSLQTFKKQSLPATAEKEDYQSKKAIIIVIQFTLSLGIDFI